jgi:hypothetical protein
MQLGFARGRGALKHLFDQIDAAARAIQLVTQQLIRGAGRCAKTAVHALAQDGFGLFAFGRADVLRGQVGLHVGLCL